MLPQVLTRRSRAANVHATAPRDPFRHEIQALRAVAVAAVLLYHLWPNRLTGGYVGVDVFFVISGFLIGSHLIAEVGRTQRIQLGAFWARRARRLLPASLLVLLVTAIAVLLLVPRSRWEQFLGEISASTFYVQNWFLASSSVDYLAATNSPSPVQHFWTLSVEEQFYVLLPLVIVLLIPIAKRLRTRITPVVWVAVVGLLLASLAYGIVSTHWSAASAYFSTFTRGWEFLFGVLIGAAPALTKWVRQTMAAMGLMMILAACVLYTGSTPFPGIAAALPVVGTGLVIWGGSSFVTTLGRLRPVALLGRVSYAVYLWHWPLIVLVPYATGRPLTTVDKVAIAAGSLLLGWASTRWIEDPARFSPRLLGKRRPRFVAVVSIIGMVIVSGVAVSGTLVSARIEQNKATAIEDIIASSPECFGAAALAQPGCDNPDLDGILAPDPSTVAEDDGNRGDCWSTGGESAFRMCTLGPDDYSLHLVAIGDSHNNTLIPAYEAIAEERGWRIDVAGRAGCYWTAAELPQSTTAFEQECAAWREQATAAIATSEADAIVVTKQRTPLTPADNSLTEQQIVAGLQQAWSNRPNAQVPILAISDNPVMPLDIVECVERDGLKAAETCAVPREQAMTFEGLSEAVEATANAHLIDMSSFYCEDVCRPVIGNVAVYRDWHHLTATYAKSLAPYLADAIAAALD